MQRATRGVFIKEGRPYKETKGEEMPLKETTEMVGVVPKKWNK